MSTWDATFLQALGWATLNSIWQMALLWALFLFVQHAFALSSNLKYKLAVASIFIGFGCYIATFLNYFFNYSSVEAWQTVRFANAPQLLPQILNAASIVYLVLLIIPLYRIISNWQFIQKIKSEGLHKAHLPYRLFIQKLSMQLGISKNVKIYISSFVVSPITVGFLKPIILLPLAAINNLTPHQVEAILLHELAHIRRHDYLVNLALTAIHVVLYFNPFVKAFLKQIEVERESCCDELVVQFEYDRIGYATALLKLETSHSQPQLAMAAANGQYLLHRIEKIVGLSRKRKFETAHFAGAFVGILMLLAINSVFISEKKALGIEDLSMETFTQPSHLFMYPTESNSGVEKKNGVHQVMASKKITAKKPLAELFTKEIFEPIAESVPEGFMHAAYNENDVALALEEKKQIEITVSNTKKVLVSQWTDVENSMADALTASEKAEAKRDYLKEVESIDWQKLEKELEATYKHRDWNEITTKVSQALVKAQLDSIETDCKVALKELHKMQSTQPDSFFAMPDVSVKEITKAKTKLKVQIDAVRKAKAKKIIHL